MSDADVSPDADGSQAPVKAHDYAQGYVAQAAFRAKTPQQSTNQTALCF